MMPSPIHHPWARTAALLAVGLAACGGETTRVPGDLIAIVDASPTECPNGGKVILSGTDADHDGSLSEAEITTRRSLCQGAPGGTGPDGSDGLDALVRVRDEPAGANCDDGGLRIEAGADSNGDGTLDADEIEQTSFACDGPEGSAGVTSLLRTRDDAGTLCETSGTIVESGVDLDGDGTLDDEEVLTSNVLCDGADGAVSTSSVSVEPAGPNCAVGGIVISFGVDEDGSGTLDPSEVEGTEYVCDRVASLVKVSVELAATSTECAGVGGSRIETGPDLDQDGILAASEVTDTRYVCGGTDGSQSLIAVTPEPAGMNCPVGGNRIQSGVDLDGDGNLAPNEVVSTGYSCNAVNGSPGSGGNAVRVSSEAAGPNCPQGGVRVQSGPDDNGNGALDDAEVTHTSYACQGERTQALASTTSEPAGPNCADGGVRIDVGIDVNQNGVLEPAEVRSSGYVCETTQTSVPFDITTTQLGGAFTGFSVSLDITAAGGTGGNYAWSVVNGSLPPGLSLSPTGTPSTQLTGTATVAGTYDFTVRVSDFFGQSDERMFSFMVIDPPCAPGQNGVPGETLSSLSSPISFGSAITGLAADDVTPASGGLLYVIDSGSSLDQFRKDGTGSGTNLLTTLSIAGGDVNTVHVIGDNIYLTNDSTSCSSNCVRRISDDKGATFASVDLGLFSPATNDALQGVAEAGGRLWMITNDPVETQLWSIDLSATSFPAAAVLEATYPDVETCNGLQADANYLYSACDDIGNGAEGLVRFDRTTLVVEPVVELSLGIGSSSWGDVHIVDTDADGDAEAAFVQGDSGATFYVCDPGGLILPAFSGIYGSAARDDESLAYDPATNSLYQIEESSSTYFRFD